MSHPIRRTLQAEGLFAAVIACVVFAQMGGSWTLFAALILLPDLAMLGYLRGPRLGALCYNLAHSALGPLLMFALAHLMDSSLGQQLALIWGAHLGFDRALGYGLKYASGFKATHLSRV